MLYRFPRATALMLAVVLALAACESDEERAERFFQSGMSLLEAGDPTRALVEFRNVFAADPLHREARLTYARVVRAQGDAGEAYSQYLRVAEQYPDDLEARLALAEMAIDAGEWDEALRHTAAARRIAPEDPVATIAQAMLDYRTAMLAEDSAAAAHPVALARARLEADPGDLIARRIVLDDVMRSGDASAARAAAEAALAAHPDRLDFRMLHLRLLAEAGDTAATGMALREMVERFPGNAEIQGLLIAWYLSEGDLAGAEAFLRSLAAAPEAGLDTRMAVVEFLRRTQGAAAAGAELDRLIAAEPNVTAYAAMRAAIDFEEGRRSEAIAAMEGLAARDGTDEEALNLKVALARMLIAEDREDEARARVDEILAADAGHVEALKLRARWLIAEDRPGEAVAALRTALAGATRDAEALTLMGQAHEREGARQLAGERYALAAEVSGRASPESLRYASFLMAEGRADAAEAVLDEAIAVAPANVELLTAMADLQQRKGDWNRATRIVWQLRAIGSAPATAAADAIELEGLLRQDRIDDTLALLDSAARSAGGDAAVTARARMVELLLRAGRLDEAQALIDEGLAAAPQDPLLRQSRAGLHQLRGETAEAEAILRALVAETPGVDRPLVALVTLLRSQGRLDEAIAATEAAGAAAPEAPGPRFMQAGLLEEAGDIEGAITLYEGLYAEESSNLVVANNLASLLAAHRPDPESLERAFTIARRLAGSDVPAFQDTYGWIEYRRGNPEEALRRLEPAAAALTRDPLVQYHLGMTYRALGRTAEARATLARALELAGDSPLPQFAEARKAIEEMGGE